MSDDKFVYADSACFEGRVWGMFVFLEFFFL